MLPHSTRGKLPGDSIVIYFFKKINLLLTYCLPQYTLLLPASLCSGVPTALALAGAGSWGCHGGWGARVPFLGCPAPSCTHCGAMGCALLCSRPGSPLASHTVTGLSPAPCARALSFLPPCRFEHCELKTLLDLKYKKKSSGNLFFTTNPV